MKTRWMVVGTLALLIVAGQLLAEKEKPAKPAKEMKFKFVSIVMDGKEVPKKDLEDMVLIVKGNKGVGKKGDKVVFEGTSTVNMKKKPWTIDVKITKGKGKGKTVKGIMKAKDGTMTICWGKPGGDRPTEFTSTEGSEQTLEVLEEVKEKE